MEQPELDLRVISEPGTMQINGKCILKKRADKFTVYITGLPVSKSRYSYGEPVDII